MLMNSPQVRVPNPASQGGGGYSSYPLEARRNRQLVESSLNLCHKGVPAMYKSVLICLMLVAAIATGCSGADSDSPPASTSTPVPIATSTPLPTATPVPTLASVFGCQWIMDTYRPMAILGRDSAISHLATSMELKIMQANPMSLTIIGTGDAAVALRECEAAGFK